MRDIEENNIITKKSVYSHHIITNPINGGIFKKLYNEYIISERKRIRKERITKILNRNGNQQ